MTEAARPRVFLLADRPGWAFDHAARALIAAALGPLRPAPDLPGRRDARPRSGAGGSALRVLVGRPDLPPPRDPARADRQGGREPPLGARGAVRTRSTRATFAARYLDDCATVTTPSLRLFELLAGHHPNLFHCPNGVDLARFRAAPRRWRGLRIAWSGNPNDAVQGPARRAGAGLRRALRAREHRRPAHARAGGGALRAQRRDRGRVRGRGRAAAAARGDGERLLPGDDRRRDRARADRLGRERPDRGAHARGVPARVRTGAKRTSPTCAAPAG